MTTSISYANDSGVHGKDGVITVKLQIGSKIATVDGVKKEIDVAPYVDPNTNRTLVPVRFLAETFGMKVKWFAKPKIVAVNNIISELDWKNDEESGWFVRGKKVYLQIGNPQYSSEYYKYEYGVSEFVWDQNIDSNIGSYKVEDTDKEFAKNFFIALYGNEDNADYKINTGLKTDQGPVIKDGRTMLPLRFLLEQMLMKPDGKYALLTWDPKTKTITITSKKYWAA